MPLVNATRSHGFAAERIHVDDTTVPVLARARPGPAGPGLVCATTVRFPAQIRQRLCSSTRPMVPVRTRSSIRWAMSD